MIPFENHRIFEILSKGGIKFLPDIPELRQKIDQIDDQLLKLINRRASLAVQIGKAKSRVKDNGHFHVPHRERDIFLRLKENNKGPFSDSAIEKVFREIFSATLALEKPLRTAFLGPESTFSHQASVRQFGHSAVFVPCANIETVFSEVEQGNCDYGVVPVENSIEGVINLTLDRFADSPLLICDELKLEIVLCLLAKTENRKKIKRIYSHPQPLAQSRGWLNLHFPGVEQIPTSSTAVAAELAKKDASSAAIAGALAAEMYKLKILDQGIQDQKENYTRFLIIGKEMAKRSKRNKTSIILSIKDEAGSLLKTLQLFAKHGISLTKIQSRPLRNQPWSYLFYIDFEGHRDDAKVIKVLDTLKKQCLSQRVLGSYPLVEPKK
jgi:chorismate mutase/prephenate dehydratase